MISLTTAKLLLAIALIIGPKDGNTGHSVQIVDESSYCVWTQDGKEWSLTQIGQVTSHWPYPGTSAAALDETPVVDKAGREVLREISRHDWRQSEIAVLNFPNGDIVEKQGHKIFYTINAGAANQRVFTILTLEHGKEL